MTSSTASLSSIEIASLEQANTKLFLFILLVFQPVYKYLEWVLNFPRINVSIFFAGITFLSLAFLLLNFGSYRKKIPFTSAWLFLFVVNIQIVSSFWSADYHPEGYIVFLKTISNTIFLAWLFFLAGMHIQQIFYSKFFKFLNFFWLLISTIIISRAAMNPLAYALNFEGVGIYLALADAFAVLSIVILSKSSGWKSIAIIFISALVLFALLSRTSFYFFVMVAGIYLLKNHKFFVFGFLLIAGFLLLQNWSELQNERMFSLILGGEDRSADMRNIMLGMGIDQIKQHAILGQFMGEVETTGIGTYIHSYLSFWRQYGMLPFFTIFILCSYYFLRILSLWLLSKKDEYIDFLFLFTFFVLMEIVFSRSYTHPYIWLALSAIPIFLANSDRKQTCS